MIFKERFNRFKIVNLQTDTNNVFKEKVLDSVGGLFNELYYIYNDKYNEEKDGLNAKNKNNFDCKKLRLTDNYQYLPEEEEQQQTSKKRDIKEPLQKPTKDNLEEFNTWISREETGINRELFQKHFKFQMP